MRSKTLEIVGRRLIGLKLLILAALYKTNENANNILFKQKDNKIELSSKTSNRKYLFKKRQRKQPTATLKIANEKR